MENADLEKVETIVNELKKITAETGFNADSLSQVIEMREKFINEGKNTEAIIVATYLEVLTDSNEEE